MADPRRYAGPPEPSAAPDDFSGVRLDREPELALRAERIRGYGGGGLTPFVFANNPLQGHGPATARALAAEVVSDP
jgi:uncharacterized protein YecE (DUF72 family)